MADNHIQIIIDAQNRAAAALAQAQAQLKALQTSTAQTSTALNAMTKATTELLRPLSAMPGAAGAAASRMSSLAESIGSVAAVSGPTALGIAAVTAGAVAAAAAIFALTKSASDYQERLDLIADSTGLTTREIGGLKVAAAAAGKSFDEVRPSIDFFTRKLGEAIRNGGEAAKAFSAVGLSVDRLKTLSTGDALNEVGRVLRGMEDGAVRSSIAFDLFGRSSSRALSVITSDLQANAQAAQDRGVVFSPETEQKLRNIDAAFDNLALTLDGFKASFTAAVAVRVEPFLTALNTMHQAVIDFLNREEVKTLQSLMAFIMRGGTPGQNQTVEVGATPAGGPSSSAMISPEFARQLSIEEAARNRKRIEDEFNDGVANAAKERERFERAMLAPMMGPSSAQFFSGQQNPFGVGFQSKEMSVDDWSARVEAAVGDLNITFTEAELRSKEYKAAMEDVNGAQVKVSASTSLVFESLSSGFRSFISTALRGIGNVEQAFASMMADILSAIGGRLVGSFLDNILPFQGGGTIAAGVRGFDTQMIRAGRGEMVVSHQDTDMLRQFLHNNMRGGGGGSSVSVPVEVHVHTMVADRKQLKEWAEDELASVVMRAAERGHRGG